MESFLQLALARQQVSSTSVKCAVRLMPQHEQLVIPAVLQKSSFQQAGFIFLGHGLIPHGGLKHHTL